MANDLLELAAAIGARAKEQNPDYADIPDAELGAQLLVQNHQDVHAMFSTTNEKDPEGNAVVRPDAPSPWTKSQTIGAPQPGEHYTRPTYADVVSSDNPFRTALEALASDLVGPGRPQSLAAADPYGIDTALAGKGSFPAFIGAIEDVGSGIRAYHGSPHDFERFDLSKVGTGEGAQAYGHGLYFAENPGVAEIYRNNLAGFPELKNLKLGTLNVGEHNRFDYSPRGNSIYENVRSSLAEDLLLDQASLTGVPPDQLQAHVLRQLDTKIRDYAQEWPEAVQDAQRLRADLARPRAVSLTYGERPGKTYEVNIHTDPKALVDWDAPITGQPDAVVDLIRERLKAAGYLRPTDNGPRQLRSALAAWHNEHAGMAEKPMEALIGTRGHLIGGTPEEVSAALRDRGVPGIRYLDQVSRTPGKGTRNYVVFDDALIEILRKYGLLPPLAAAAGARALQPTDSGGSE